jgi:hypothetical protein
MRGEMNTHQAAEDLEFIKKVIDGTRRAIVDNGFGFIFWGIIIVAGLLSTYAAVFFKFNFPYAWNWLLVIGIGWIYSLYSGYTRRGVSKVYTFSGKLLGAVWISAGVAMTILGFVGTFAGAYNGVYISPILSTILGIAFFISGYLYDKKWITYLSAGWWAGAIIMFIYPYLYTLLLMTAMMIVLQVIPGIIIYRDSKKLKGADQ